MAVVRLRRLLIRSAETVAEGGDPIGLHAPVDTEKISGGAGIVADGTSWGDLVPGNVTIA
jgi:hypothetical protein